MNAKVEITADDLNLPNVLNQYYTFLKKTISQTSDRLFLFNSVTPFDIYAESPLYNENVFANHANIVIGTSPAIVDESQGISLNDSFSKYYGDVMRTAAAKIERTHLTPENWTEIADLENDIDHLRSKSRTIELELAKAWETHWTALGLKPDTLEYDLQKIDFHNFSGAATQLADIFNDILVKLTTIQEIKETAVPQEYRDLIRISVYIRSKEYKMYRPYRPQLEFDGDVTYWELAKLLATAKNVTALKDLVQESEQIYPFADLKLMFKDAQRSFEIGKQHSSLEEHDKDWSVSGSGRRFSLFKTSLSASYKEEVEKSVKSTSKISIGFKAIHDIRVNRREWYDESLFDLDVVKDVLRSNPKLARNTRYVITSMILGRGSYTEFTFDQKEHYQKMTDFKSQVSGKATVGFISFGVAGHYHQYDFKQENDSASQKITFKDGETVCRILALRYQKVHDIGSRSDFFEAFNYTDEYDFEAKAFTTVEAPNQI